MSAKIRIYPPRKLKTPYLHYDYTVVYYEVNGDTRKRSYFADLKSAVVVMLVDGNPALVFLRPYVVFAGFALGYQSVEILFKPLGNRFSRIHCTSENFSVFHKLKNLNPFQFVPVTSLAIPESAEYFRPSNSKASSSTFTTILLPR